MAAKSEQIAKLKQHISTSHDFEEKYTMAKEKLGEVAGEKAALEEKYANSKVRLHSFMTFQSADGKTHA